MYDADDPGMIINEFLITIFGPAILVFVGLWVVFRVVFNDVLLSYGLSPIVPQPGYGAISAGYGRLLLLIILTAALVLPYIALYMWMLRKPLRDRGIV